VTQAEPHEERRWLQRLVGDWTYESEASPAPGEPPASDAGTERVRALGGAWVLCEGRSDAPGGGLGTTLMTLGYDPGKRRVVGTFVASTMPQLWIYEGGLDPEAVLTLETEGPSLTREGETGRYRDTIAFRGDDHRVHTSRFLGDHGEWQAFMTTTYRRTT
jgi:hypothetical protein